MDIEYFVLFREYLHLIGILKKFAVVFVLFTSFIGCGEFFESLNISVLRNWFKLIGIIKLAVDKSFSKSFGFSWDECFLILLNACSLLFVYSINHQYTYLQLRDYRLWYQVKSPLYFLWFLVELIFNRTKFCALVPRNINWHFSGLACKGFISNHLIKFDK